MKYSKPLFDGLCDIHNHLLPGIDDGSKNLSMSLNMLDTYQKLGFKSVIPTPHIYKELYPNTPESIKKSFDILKQNEPKENTIKVMSYSAEYMVDEIFLNHLEQNNPLLFIKENHILLETNFFGNTAMLEMASFILSQRNITPILAHPERYHLIDSISEYKNLKNKGFYFQLNALSLLGHYGSNVKNKAEKLLKAGLFDLVATDAHCEKDLRLLENLKLTKKQGIQWDAIKEFQLELI